MKGKQIEKATYAILILLLFMCAYLCTYLLFFSEDFINNSYNRRLTSLSDHVIRGSILSIDGEVLARTEESNGTEIRTYPKGSAYAHAVGFATLGMSGLERDYNFRLYRTHNFIFDRLYNEIRDVKNPGDSLVTTIDSRLQSIAHEGLSGYKGAVIAMDVNTGAILAEVSKPDFNPNKIESIWDDITNNPESSVLVNRTTQGLYPPGSTFKILTALSYIKSGGSLDDEFDCEGSYTNGSTTIHCYKSKVHGHETLRDAFANSCNSVFAMISENIDKDIFMSVADSLLFNKALPGSLSEINTSSFYVGEDTQGDLMMQTAIGQGNTLMSPYHMLLICAAIAGEGRVLEPRLADSIINDSGNKIKTYKSKNAGRLLSKSDCDTIKELMRGAVTYGTATKLNKDKYEAYGKTGTAEFSSDKNKAHSWFCGFAKNGEKTIAIVVIMEEAGAGSEYATPLAGRILDAYFDN